MSVRCVAHLWPTAPVASLRSRMVARVQLVGAPGIEPATPPITTDHHPDPPGTNKHLTLTETPANAGVSSSHGYLRNTTGNQRSPHPETAERGPRVAHGAIP